MPEKPRQWREINNLSSRSTLDIRHFLLFLSPFDYWTTDVIVETVQFLFFSCFFLGPRTSLFGFFTTRALVFVPEEEHVRRTTVKKQRRSFLNQIPTTAAVIMQIKPRPLFSSSSIINREPRTTRTSTYSTPSINEGFFR